MKKVILILIFIFGIVLPCISVSANTNLDTSDDETYKLDYELDREMRAVWISPLVNDIPRFTSETQYKNAILDVFKNMEKFNLNTMIFHIRMYNDAVYESLYNNWSSYYNTNPSWDALPWVIEECHKRGYEFHAWMNPYRVASSGTLSSVASRFPKSNLASNPDNLLKGSDTIILNPGIPAVQDFLVNVCMEVVYKYDVDAIHFDDYFYVTGIDDTKTYGTYGIGQGIEQFRRDSVDTFIKSLKRELDRYNEKNGECVELGISPTAAWANGDGVVTYDEEGNAISNGSKGVTQGHYGNYLYCDTLKWINEEWIDYILPQCYIGTSNGNELFYGTVDWWSKVCKYKKTKVYIGIGLYRAGDGDWQDLTELKRQFDYMAQYDNVEGFSIFSYRHIKSTSSAINQNLQNAISYFEDEVYAPEILKDVKNSNLALNEYYILNEGSKHSIGFTKLDGIKYYVLLKKTNDNYELLDVYNSDTVYVDENNGYCEYYLAPMLNNNTIGNYVKLTTDDVYNEVKVYGYNNEYLYSKYYKEIPDMIEDEAPIVDGYRFIGWEKVGNNFQAKYEEDVYKVTYYVNNEVYYVEYVKPGEDAKGIKFDSTGGKFSGWDKKAEDVTADVDIYGTFEKNKYTIKFYDGSTLLEERIYEYGDEVVFDIFPTKEGYQFDGFMNGGKIYTSFTVTKNLTLYAQFSERDYIIQYNLDGGTCNNLVESFRDPSKVVLPIPTKDGYKFVGWYDTNNLDEKIEKIESKDYDLTAKWQKLYYVTYDLDGGICDNLITEFSEEINNLPIPVKDGYEFLGWYLLDTEIKVDKFELDNYSIVAKWEKKVYTVIYDLNGGVCDNLVYEFVEEIDTLPIPTKEGYEFVGWYIANSDILVDSLELQDYSLVAKWKEKIFKITYILNGNSNEEVVTFKSADEVTLKEPTLEGYKFIGWFELNDNDEEIKVEIIDNRDYVLYAKYEKVSGCGDSMIKLLISLSLLFVVLIKRRK